MFGTDVLGPFQFGDDALVEAEVADGVAPDVDFLGPVEDQSCLPRETVTLSLSTADSILMFMNLSTPRRVPL